MSHFSANMKA